MGQRIRKVNDPRLEPGEEKFLFFCPGCKEGHCVVTPRWSWDGSYERPTFNPSVLTGFGENFSEERCHSFVRDGQIQFLSDCYHKLANQTVDLPEI